MLKRSGEMLLGFGCLTGESVSSTGCLKDLRILRTKLDLSRVSQAIGTQCDATVLEPFDTPFGHQYLRSSDDGMPHRPCIDTLLLDEYLV